MARPLREGSLGEPPAPLPAPPACRMGGGALPSPPTRRGGRGGTGVTRGGTPPTAASHPRRCHPRLSCACAPRHAEPPSFGLDRCGATRGPPAHGHPTQAGAHQGAPPQILGGGGVIPNGHPPTPGEEAPPGPEQELGARLRRLGDAFHQIYEQQALRRERRGGGGAVFWGHLYRLLSQLLGGVYDLRGGAGGGALPARGGN